MDPLDGDYCEDSFGPDGPTPGDNKAGVFSDDEEQRIIEAFLQCRGSKPVTQEEIAEVLELCTQIRMGALYLNFMFSGHLLVDLTDDTISFPMSPEHRYELEENTLTDEIDSILGGKEWGSEFIWPKEE